MRIAALTHFAIDSNAHNVYSSRRRTHQMDSASMTQPRKQPPFSINHDDARSLLRQVTDGLRLAIADGYYRCGDLLPSSRDLAPALGVSKIVTEAALKRLADEGLVISRPRLGTVVRDRAAKQWLGHVVFVYNSANIGYFQNAMAETLRSRLNEAGYLFTRAAATFDSSTGKSDLSPIDAALAHSVDLVMAMTTWRELPGYLARRGIPYAYITPSNPKPFGVGSTRFDKVQGLNDMAKACRAKGIRKAVLMHCFRLTSLAEKAFVSAGIAVERKVFGPVGRAGNFTDIERAGLEGFGRMIKSGRIDRDTIYYFEDDYVARGGLMAMALAGLHAPEDIRVATLANAGFLPAYDRDLTRIEIDPVKAGSAAADDALAFLKTGHYPDGQSVGYRFVQGSTFN